MAKDGKPRMYDTGLLLAAGVDRAVLKNAQITTGRRNRKTNLEDFKMVLRVVDEQDAVNRYRWYNLPGGITGQELERMIYYKGQVCLFRMPNGKFYFMPYALDGTIDYYGRYNRVHPIPYNEGKEKQTEAARRLLNEIKLEPQYDVLTEDGGSDRDKMCVLLHDYTKQRGQEILPRQRLQEPVINFEAETFPMARTSMIAASGVKGLRVQDADQKEEVQTANDQLYDAVLSGCIFVPIEGTVDFQEISDKSSTKAEDYLMQMQAIDNFRLSLLGIDNGGLFQKKAHKLQDEQDMNQSPASLTYDDGLAIRQNFCIIANSIWPIGIWCDQPDYLKKKQSDNTPEENYGDEDDGGSSDE